MVALFVSFWPFPFSFPAAGRRRIGLVFSELSEMSSGKEEEFATFPGSEFSREILVGLHYNYVISIKSMLICSNLVAFSTIVFLGVLLNVLPAFLLNSFAPIVPRL